MIDLIIPVYDNTEKIDKTLASVAIQTIKDKVNVYLINTGCNLKKEIDFFKSTLNIKELKYDNYTTTGQVKDFAMNNTNGDYILFLFPGDELYNCYALKILYENIENNNLDIVMGRYYFFTNGFDDALLVENPYSFYDLFGKMYRRSTIQKNGVHFNHSEIFEDDSFHALALYTSNNVSTIEDIIYVNNVKKRNEIDDISYYIAFMHNRLWFSNELKKRNYNKEDIYSALATAYIFVFHELYNSFENCNYEKLYKHCQRFEKEFSKYNDLLDTTNTLNQIIVSFFNTSDESFVTYIKERFNHFRNNFRKVGE